MTSDTTEAAPSPEIDFGTRVVPGWYWLLSGQERQRYEPRANAATGPLRHVYSYERSREAIKEEILELIKNAQDKVFLASFRFIDADLREALRQKAQQLRGGVYVITSLQKKDLYQALEFTPSYEDGEEDWFDEDWSAGDGGERTAKKLLDEESKKHYPALCRSGIWLRGHPKFHAKFLVVDDQKALVSSANLESTALVDAVDRPGRRPGFDAVTGECGVVTTRPGDAKMLGRFFARLWQAECTFDAPASTAYKVSPRDPASPTFRLDYTPPDACGPIWTGAGDRLILKAIHRVCELAERDLVLATFSTKNLEQHWDLLYRPVRAALESGVRVRLLLRPHNWPEARATAGLLASWGVEVYGDDKTHAKCVIADGRHGAIFSANFDAEHGIYSGTEVGMRLDGDPVLADVAHFFDHCMACAPQRIAEAPTVADCTRLASRGLRPWPLPGRLVVVADNAAWDALAATAGPALFTKREATDQEVTLHADGGKWNLSRAGDTWRLTMIERPSLSPGRAALPPTLLENWLNPRQGHGSNDPYRQHGRGICPAVMTRA